MSGYWIDAEENPFNQMSYTRGGGGYDNSMTTESNDRRAHAMQGAGASALPHFATAGVAQAVLPAGGYAVVGDDVVKTRKPTSAGAGPGKQGASTAAEGKAARTSGAGSQLAFSGPLEMGIKDSGTEILMGGDWFKSNPWWSDVEEWEARYGEPGEWLGGAVVMGVDAAFNVARGIDAVSGSRIVSDRSEAPPAIKYGNGLETVLGWADHVGGAFARQDAQWSQQLHRQFGTGYVVPMGGF